MAEHKNQVDELTGAPTTGHEWDGLRELNTPLPRWWLWTFYATIVWSIGYWVVYPSWPLISSYTSGISGWSSRAAVVSDIAALKAIRGPMTDRLAATPLGGIVADPQLLDFARAQARPAERNEGRPMASQPMPTTIASALWPSRGDAAGVIRMVVLAFAGTLLMTLSAKIKVPFYPVPMTMQTLVVLALGAAYGARLGAATVVLGESALQVQAFAAPRSGGLWQEIRREIAMAVERQGGTVEEHRTDLGAVLKTRMPSESGGRTVFAPATFLGVDGPRWFLRGVLSGRAAIDDSAAGPLLDVFRAVVVVRGSDPMAPRELLPLRLPSDAAEAPDAAEADGEGETPSIDPFERGPEITEVR